MHKPKLLISILLVLTLTNCQEPPDSKNTLATEVKKEFQRSWNGYKTHAFGHDVLKPLSKSSSDWYAQSLHISPIDAYSTMKVMGLDEEAEEVHNYIVNEVDFNKDLEVKTFEVNIRILGGLLAMYQYTGDEKVLALAADFGDRMLAAFNSPTGIPYYWFNLKTGAVKGEEVNVAEAGSYMLEMGVLSSFTGNPVYYDAAKKASKAIYDRRSQIGLTGERINIVSGEWTDERSHVGCCIDSYLEYLYKSWLLFGDEKAKEMWENSIAAINNYVAEDHKSGFWYGQANMHTGEMMNRIVTLYDAYFPALLAISGDVERAKKLQASWDRLWDKNGLEPKVYDYSLDSITNPGYDLNPEIIESAYCLYKITGKEKYRRMNEKYFADLVEYCKNDVAFHSMDNVITKEPKDNMPTFFFAETLKYLYLTFSEKDANFLEEHVFSTEAHPFRKKLFEEDETIR
jgi:hypothetical protein